jgi:hypothetical protein
VRLAPPAAAGFEALEPSARQRLVEMLCDVAEVATLAPGVVEFSRGEGPCVVRAGPCVALYSIGESHEVTVHHVVAAEVLRLIA